MVLAREDEPGDNRLVAYYRGESALQTEALRACARECCPSTWFPARTSGWRSMPRTPSGKLDRKALPAPDAGRMSSREYEAPEGEVEVALAQIWSEVLRRERVGRHDNFFELGGHSLLGVQLLFETAARAARRSDAHRTSSPIPCCATWPSPWHGAPRRKPTRFRRWGALCRHRSRWPSNDCGFFADSARSVACTTSAFGCA